MHRLPETSRCLRQSTAAVVEPGRSLVITLCHEIYEGNFVRVEPFVSFLDESREIRRVVRATRVRVSVARHEIDPTTEKETAELKFVEETKGDGAGERRGEKKGERTLGREGDCEHGRRGRRASVELIRARVFEERSRWNALHWPTHHEPRLFHSQSSTCSSADF